MRPWLRSSYPRLLAFAVAATAAGAALGDASHHPAAGVTALASYGRTVYGRSVIVAHVVSAGVATAF